MRLSAATSRRAQRVPFLREPAEILKVCLPPLRGSLLAQREHSHNRRRRNAEAADKTRDCDQKVDVHGATMPRLQRIGPTPGNASDLRTARPGSAGELGAPEQDRALQITFAVTESW